MNTLTVLDNDLADAQEWDNLCSVLRNWEPEEDRKRNRWKWLVQSEGFASFMRLSALSVERRHAAVNNVQRLQGRDSIEPGLLAVIASGRSLNETKTPTLSEEMLDELGL